jgi:hypothetical protein
VARDVCTLSVDSEATISAPAFVKGRPVLRENWAARPTKRLEKLFRDFVNLPCRGERREYDRAEEKSFRPPTPQPLSRTLESTEIMKSVRTQITLAATVAAALSITLIGAAGAAHATGVTGASSVLAAVNNARVANGTAPFASNGYLTAFAQEVAANYAAHGRSGLTAPTADGAPQSCSGIAAVVATASGQTAAAVISAKFSASDFDRDNYGAVGYVVKGSAAYAVYVATNCASAPSDKITSGTVKLSGTPQRGEQLTAEVSGFALSDPASSTDRPKLEYSWSEKSASGDVTQLPNILPIYVPPVADIGSKISVTVTASAPGYDTVSASSAYGSAVKPGVLPNPKTLAVSGKRNVGETLSISSSAWTSGLVSPTLVTSWYRDGKTIAGATSMSYTQVAADYGHKITAKVTSSAPGFTTVSKTSATSAKTGYPFVKGVTATISGTVATGSVVTATPLLGAGAPTGAMTYSYQWYEAGKKVSGATHATHTVGTPAAESNELSVAITARAPYYTTTIITSPNHVVEKSDIFSNTPTVIHLPAEVKTGARVTITPGTWTPAPAVRYQWYCGGIGIIGATHSYYTLTAAEHGCRLALRQYVSKAGYYDGYNEVSVQLPDWTV